MKKRKKIKAKRGAGRPAIVLDAKDRKRLADLCRVGCTNDEISALMGVSWDTLDRNYAEIIKKARADIRMSLRRKQISLANQGDTTMLIWLGKQMLGQKNPPQEITPPSDGSSFKFTFDIGPAPTD